jgi:hypothetical protein
MGNQTSTLEKRDTKDINILVLMDMIAAKLVLTQNFEDLTKLEDKKYCDDLTILTSKVIQERLSSIEVSYLNQRIKDGYTIDEETSEKIIFLKDNDLPKLDITNANKKRRICMGISRFYVRVAQLFAAIVNTINPIYTYRDEAGIIQKVPFMQKMHIPENMRKNAKVSRSGLCTNRIQSLMVNALKDTEITELNSPNMEQNIQQETTFKGGNKETYDIKNKVCSMNSNTKILNGKEVIETKHLIDEPGIPELMNLYKDVFDYKTGKYTSMSEQSKKAYMRDLQIFYKAFTGKEVMPPEIQTFSDIPLKDFHNSPACKEPNQGLNTSFKNVEISNTLMSIYGAKLSKMIQNMNTNQNKLIEILDKVFVYRIDPKTQNKIITLHPNLSIEKLEKIIEKSREYIVNIFVGCENDFMSTLGAFEAIVEEQIQKNIEQKIKLLRQQEEEKLTGL